MKPRTSRASAGFTLVELMIALVISGIVIGSMYTVGAASSRHFQVQHQIATMQSALRFAMSQVKRDVMRAGFMSTPMDDPPGIQFDCQRFPSSANAMFGGTGWIAGISSFQNNIGNVVDPTGNNAINGFTSDEITLIGNYATSNDYPIATIDATRSVITINTVAASTWHSVQTDFGWSAAGTATTIIDPGRVTQAFPRDGLIRLEAPGGKRHYAALVGPAQVTGTEIRLTFNPQVPPDLNCAMERGRVAPLQVIRYGAGLSALNTAASDRATGAIAQLVRSHRFPLNMNQPMPGSVARVVVDYLAAFNLAFTMTAVTGQVGEDDNPDLYTIGNSASRTESPAFVNANPDLIRAIAITLAVRAPSTDPGMRFFNCGNLQCMQLDATAGPGGPAARVRTLRAEVFLPNLANEGYR